MTEFSAQVDSNSLPPQNIDAEESILGGILLDPDALGRIIDLIEPEAFYVKAHRDIYEAAIALNSQGKPTDLMTVTTWLADRDLLEKIGGTAALARLVSRTISAVNIDRYAELVMDKYQRRQLIGAGHQIAEFGYDTATDLETVLDRSEQTIFSLTQNRPQQGLVPISDTIAQTFNNIEQLYENTALPGIESNFYDLDAMTSGFQRSDLIIVAGRPSMGKCIAASSEIVLADGSLTTIEQICQRRRAQLLTLKNNWQFDFTEPSAFVDDGVKPVFRVTTRLGRSIETTITHPYLTIRGWRRLSQLQPGVKIAVPGKIDVFGKETIDECQVKLLGYFLSCESLTNIVIPDCIKNDHKLFQDFIAAAIKSSKKEIIDREEQQKQLDVFSNLEAIEEGRRQETEGRRELSKGDSILADNLPYAFPPKEEDLLINRLLSWLKSLGIDENNFSIPAIVFKLTRAQISLFLNRLFATAEWIESIDSDRAQLRYNTVSEVLARQIQHLWILYKSFSAQQ